MTSSLESLSIIFFAIPNVDGMLLTVLFKELYVAPLYVIAD